MSVVGARIVIEIIETGEPPNQRYRFGVKRPKNRTPQQTAEILRIVARGLEKQVARD